MARPRKCRRVCSLPEIEGMQPIGSDGEQCCKPVVMLVEEYETVRLIDYEGLTQEECSEKMQISRPTVTAIYMKARQKIAEALVTGRALIINGGDFVICNKNHCRHKRGLSNIEACCHDNEENS